ncbi:hypothetical protein HN011_008825, partial [Eciton burchellii]
MANQAALSPNAYQRQIELYRRKKEQDPVSVLSKLSMIMIADLEDHFSRDTSDFNIWEQQLILIKKTYELIESYTRILISTKLKTKILKWFRSNPTRMNTSSNDLLKG